MLSGPKIFGVIPVPLLLAVGLLLILLGGVLANAAGITFRPEIGSSDYSADLQQKNELSAFIYNVGATLLLMGGVLFVASLFRYTLDETIDRWVRFTMMFFIIAMNITLVLVFIFASPLRFVSLPL